MADVLSVCLSTNHGFIPQFVFSTSVDGKIKAWLYDLMGSRVDYDAPGRSCTTMLYSADGKRLIFHACYLHSNYVVIFTCLLENAK